jgi:gliding motility-associated-like protein
MPADMIAVPQKNVSGEINQTRSRVEVLGADFVDVADASGFSPGDTVLLIQMKGDAILTDNDASFGLHYDHVGAVGYYEFIVIQTVDGINDRLTFFNLIEGGYDPEAFVQVVKVESYQSLRVTGEISAPAWDPVAGTGGVVAIFAIDKVILEADISVDGKGFRGGIPSVISGACIESSPWLAYFNSSSDVGGNKGEGYASHDFNRLLLNTSLYSKGPGSFSTGGGGGWGNLSGAGGGGSYSYGGVGGDEGASCGIPNPGGQGGRAIADAYTDILQPTFTDPVLMGGGGGSGGYTSGGAPAGGHGGGIIFIMTDSVYGNGHSISANGLSVTETALLTAGGAGGGAAGAIVISASGYGSSLLTISADGGDGGNAANNIGVGGGGSGGGISLAPATYSSLTLSNSGGEDGFQSPSGDDGPTPSTTYQIRLNGFLFNTVVTLESGFLLDSICEGEVPPQLLTSTPVGGTAPLTTFWEKSYNETDWVPASGTVSGNIFTPSQAESATLWIRRRIVDNSTPAIEDISKPVKIVVHPNIVNFEIAHDIGDTICFNQDVEIIEPVVPVPGGGNSIYSYEWHSGADGVLYDPAPIGSGSAYDPPSLESTTWYRRTVRSGACVDSSSSVRITVLPVITGNTVEADQVICEGDLFDALDDSGSGPEGGDGTYRFRWEASIDNVNWDHTIEGITDQQSYDPDETSTDFPSLAPKYYRRIVYSGEADCCADISAPVSLIMQPEITLNTLSLTEQVVCEGVNEVQDVTGSTPEGGTGDYSYSWEYLTTPPGTWQLLSDSVRKDLSIKVLYETTSFRRVVNSGVCSNISSDIFAVTVNPAITGNIVSTLSDGTDTIICSGQDPLPLTGPEPSGGMGPGTFTYLWQDSTAGGAWVPAPAINTNADYDPEPLTATTWYRRVAYSGECELVSNIIEVTVLSPVSGNTIGQDETVCYGTAPSALEQTEAVGGGDGTYRYLWQSDSDPLFSSPVDEGAETAFQPGNITNVQYYRRIVYSGLADCCADTSNTIQIDIWDLPVADMSPLQDEQICEGESLEIELSITSGLAPYQVLLNDGSTDIPALVQSAAGTHIHPLTPGYGSDMSLTYTIVSVEDANGCLAAIRTGQKDVDFYERPSSFAGSDDEVCGFEYQMNAVSSAGTGSWSWDGPTGIFSNIAEPDAEITFSEFAAGDTTLTLWWKEVNVLERCADSAFMELRMWKEPDIADAGPDSILLPFQVDVELFARTPVVGTGQWTSLPDGVSVANSNEPSATATGLPGGSSLFEWTVSNGVCESSIDIVELTVPAVRLISGFSPNGDGINDYFVIDGLVEWDGGVVDNEFVVTDMTGVVQYSETNYGNDWDGRDMRGNPLPSGTYYYFINVKYSKEVLLKGFVVIKRD